MREALTRFILALLVMLASLALTVWMSTHGIHGIVHSINGAVGGTMVVLVLVSGDRR